MSKAIEEAAKEYADNAYYPAPDYDWYESDDEQMKDVLVDTFKAGAKHVYDLPLAQRLTDAEKEMVRKTYKAMSDYGKKKDVVCADCANYATRVGLECIFGKEFFKEEKL